MNIIGVRFFVVLLACLASFIGGLVSEKNDFVERSMRRFNHDEAPPVTSEDNVDTSSRALLASILGQTGLSPLDIPELSFASGNGQTLSAFVLSEKRREILRALPLISPAQGWFASGFGQRIDPVTRRVAEHKGLDISNNPGTPIIAPADGIVRFASTFGHFGNYVSIVHGQGVLTKYGHLKDVLVHKGQVVKKGDVIALMGSSGKSTGTHLHYEIWINDHAFNPYAFMPKVMSHNNNRKENTPQYMLLAGQP